jgi:hypothetical protein
MDHRKAVIVLVTDAGEETRLVISRVEKQLRRSGGSPLKGPYEARQVPADDSRQRAFAGHLDIYYDAVIACVRDAGAILVLGPGEAKREFGRRLAGKKLGARIIGTEAADKMTDRQIAARVRRYFRAGARDRPAASRRRRRAEPRTPPTRHRAGPPGRGR